MKAPYKQEERTYTTTKSWVGGAEGYSALKSKNFARKEKIRRLFLLENDLQGIIN